MSLINPPVGYACLYFTEHCDEKNKTNHKEYSGTNGGHRDYYDTYAATIRFCLLYYI